MDMGFEQQGKDFEGFSLGSDLLLIVEPAARQPATRFTLGTSHPLAPHRTR